MTRSYPLSHKIRVDKRKLIGLAYRTILSELHIGKQYVMETLNRTNKIMIPRLQQNTENGSVRMHL